VQHANSYDFYRILGIHASASAEAIEQAFLSLSTRIPPELQTADNPTYQRIVQAHQILSDAKRRAAYDAFLNTQAAPVLRMETEVSSEKIPLLDTAQILYLFVNIYPPAQQNKVHIPLNLTLVIDRSTSMQGMRLERVKAAVNLILDKLAPEDVLSVVSFSDRAETILPAGNIGENKSGLLIKIRGMQASGGTEIYQGLQAGITQLNQVSLADYTNHLILLTDGHTYGDAEKCLELAEKTAAQGIGFSAFGLGSEWNDDFLDKLVSPSGGRSDYIEKPAQIIEYLQHHINGLGDVYARNVCLQVDLPKPMILQYGFKLTPFAQPIFAENKEFKLGNIEGRSPLKILLELNLQPQKKEVQLSIPLKLTAEIPSQKQSMHTAEENVQLEIQTEPPQVEPPPELLKAVRVLNIYRLNEKVRNEVEVGELEAATKRMKHLTTRLLEVGETQLAQQAHMELARLEKMGDLSEEGRKRLKYGTRSLFSGLLQDLDLDQ
jgi:Ca-activated chloride channel family protein